MLGLSLGLAYVGLCVLYGSSAQAATAVVSYWLFYWYLTAAIVGVATLSTTSFLGVSLTALSAAAENGEGVNTGAKLGWMSFTGLFKVAYQYVFFLLASCLVYASAPRQISDTWVDWDFNKLAMAGVLLVYPVLNWLAGRIALSINTLLKSSAIEVKTNE